MSDTTVTPAAPPVAEAPPRATDDRVPADQRIAGLDRRTIWPGVVLLVVWALWAHAVPWIDDRIEVDNPIVAGDVVDLGSGELTFVPATGWNLESGALVTERAADEASVPATALLSSDTVSYSARSGNWDGSSEELADRMIDIDDSLDELVARDEQGRSSIENADGVPGELVYLVGVDQAALVAAFVFDRGADGGDGSADIGVEIEVRGTPDQIEDLAEDVARMIDTTTYRPDGQGATP